MTLYSEPFENRSAAGKELAKALAEYKETGCLVLAIPRGGVVVGYEVASFLNAELDVIVPRKIRAPHQEELAIGAVSSWGNSEYILDEHTISFLGVSSTYIEREINEQLIEIDRRLRLYRGTSEPPNVEGRKVILVDDGIATGYTTRAAALALRKLGAKEIILAVPVGPLDSLEIMSKYVEKVICLMTPTPFAAVGYWYNDFQQVSDAQVINILNTARSEYKNK